MWLSGLMPEQLWHRGWTELVATAAAHLRLLTESTHSTPAQP